MPELPPTYWSRKAEEARRRAGDMHDAGARAVLLDISTKYQRMAQRAEARAAVRRSSAIRDTEPQPAARQRD